MIFIIALVALILIYFFPIVHVIGESMCPTLEDDSYILASRLHSINEGDIAVFYSEYSERYNVKRCAEKKEYYNPHTKELQYKYYFLGDNKENSIDSREYGYVDEEHLVAKIILPKNL